MIIISALIGQSTVIRLVMYKRSDSNQINYSNLPTSEPKTQVLRWYKDHGLEVIPVHPKESSIEDISTISEIKQVQNPKSTSLSVITPPKISLSIIKTALQDLHVNAVWLQPGAEDQEVKDWIASADESIQSKIIYGGPCILVQGENLAKAKGKL
jgi:predicted CoA-binding protein